MSVLKAVDFPAKAEHNKAVNLPLQHTWPPTADAGNGDVSERTVFSYILC